MPERDHTEHIRLLHEQMEQMKVEGAKRNRDSMLEFERRMCDKFRILREERGWSQRDLAERVREYGFDFHQSTIAKLEAGTRPLRVAEMYALSHVFKMPPGAVFFMVYGVREFSGFDELTEMLAREEESRADMEKIMLKGVEQTIQIMADHQTRMNSLVDTMRRTAASDPALSEELAQLNERYPENPTEEW